MSDELRPNPVPGFIYEDLLRENKRLREALETIRDFGGDPAHGFADGEQCAKQARKALEETK